MSGRAMKDSGVPWIGEIPVGWGVVRLGRISDSYCDGPFGSGLKSSHYVESGVRVIRLKNIGSGVFQDSDAAFISTEHFTSLGGHDAQSGDLILAGLGDDNHPVGRACVLPKGIGAAMVKADCFRFRLDHARISSTYVCWYLSSSPAIQESRAETRGATRSRINLSDAARIRVVFPPIAEQQRIAAFLDERTSDIDSALAEHASNLDLLTERRRTLISRAVTRGINADAAMNDGRIDGVEKIPATWRRSLLKHTLSSIEQGWSPQCDGRPVLDDEWGVLKVGCVNGSEFDADENKALPITLSPIPEYLVHDGELLMSRANTRALVGSIAIARTRGRRLLLCDKLYRLRLRDTLDVSFARYALTAPSARSQIEAAASGASASMLNISQDIVRNLMIPLPPIAEQRRIAVFLDERTAEIDAAMAETRRAIELLREYRQSLITAAVTGRIDLEARA